MVQTKSAYFMQSFVKEKENKIPVPGAVNNVLNNGYQPA